MNSANASPPPLVGYGWAAGGVAGATVLFWGARGYLDKGHASLLYLPVVIACATRFGFGPAVLGAVGSFFCWNYFFLPPYHTWQVENPKDWLALLVFLLVALVTARQASQARFQAQAAQEREREAIALQRASEQISNEVETSQALPALARQIVATCGAQYCHIYQAAAPDSPVLALAASAFGSSSLFPPDAASPERMARAQDAHEQGVPAGLHTPHGIYAPLRVGGRGWGIIHVGPRQDGKAYSRPQEGLILALANHAAVALARQALRDQAAQAQALREADELKSTLLSLVSHELRTPLAAIKASASGLLLQSHEGAQGEALQAINDESDRLGELVSKLLDLSRLEAGAWKPDLDWCDMVDVLGAALARLPEREGGRVHVQAPPDLPLVRADFVQIAQVLTNLLENALKYAPPPSPVTVTLSADETALRVDVADRGMGVPPGQAEAVFQTFHRLDCHRRSGPPGTGLGLAICRDIVQAHAGRIWEENGPDGGAVFSFTLPRPETPPDWPPQWKDAPENTEPENTEPESTEEGTGLEHAHSGGG